MPLADGAWPARRAASTARVSSGKSSRSTGAAAMREVPVRIKHDEYEPLDPRVVPDLELHPSNRRVDGAEAGDALDGRPSAGGRDDGIPGAAVASHGERHLGPPAKRPRQSIAEGREQPELDPIGDRLSLGIGGDPESEPEYGGDGAKVGDVRGANLAALDPPEHRTPDPCRCSAEKSR